MQQDGVLSRIGMRINNAGCADALQISLLRRGFLCDCLESETGIAHYCACLCPAAVLLELAPETALKTVRQIRASGFKGPLITILDEILDLLRVELLQAGADDVIAPLPQISQLLQRLDFVLESYGEDAVTQSTKDVQIALTPTEVKIIDVLKQAAPEPLSRDDIMWMVKKQRIAPDDRGVDVYISNIRRKFRLLDVPMSIETIRGRGFRYIENMREQGVHPQHAKAIAGRKY